MIITAIFLRNEMNVSKTIDDVRKLWHGLDEDDEDAIVDELWAQGEAYALEAMDNFGWDKK